MDGETTTGIPAGLFRRLAALCYDALVAVALGFVATFAMLPLTRGEAILTATQGLVAHAYHALLVLLVFAYFGWSWTRSGQTLGMRAWRIRVVRTDGGALTWRQSLARFAAGVVAAAPAGLGLWWSFLDADKRGWHDRWTGTRVVRTATAGKH